MSMFSGMGITSSALTAQRLRMDVISSNMANADTTRATFENGNGNHIVEKQLFLSQKIIHFPLIYNLPWVVEM